MLVHHRVTPSKPFFFAKVTWNCHLIILTDALDALPLETNSRTVLDGASADANQVDRSSSPPSTSETNIQGILGLKIINRFHHSCTQSPQACWSVGGRRERRWGNGKKIWFFWLAVHCHKTKNCLQQHSRGNNSMTPESLPATTHWPRSLRTLGMRLSFHLNGHTLRFHPQNQSWNHHNKQPRRKGLLSKSHSFEWSQVKMSSADSEVQPP